MARGGGAANDREVASDVRRVHAQQDEYPPQSTVQNVLALRPLRDTLAGSPLVVIDVGAAGGIQPIWRPYEATGLCKFFGFEPNPDNFRRLTPTANTKFFQMAISDDAGEAEFYAHRTVGSLQPRLDRERLSKEDFHVIKVQVETLARLKQNGVLPRLDFLKTDVERQDARVLLGANPYLEAELLGVTCEFDYYRVSGNLDFSVMHQMLSDRDFLLFSISSKNGPVGELQGGDFLYLKDIGSLMKQNSNPIDLRAKVLKLYCLSMIFGYSPYAYVIVRMAKDAGLVSDEQASELLMAARQRVFLPTLTGFSRIRLRAARALTSVALILAGKKWGSKGAPRLNDLYMSNRLSLDSRWLPRKLNLANLHNLETAYENYQALRGVYYPD